MRGSFYAAHVGPIERCTTSARLCLYGRMTHNANFESLNVTHIDDVPRTLVAKGIYRRDLSTTAFARGWLIDFEPGSQWPEIDHHATEERYLVLSGEVLEGNRRVPAGSYVVFPGGSSHRPSSETGATILGINIERSPELD